ncbi:MAG: PKD domain-containing protein [Candidatus Diapherotrites archaeon]
MQLLSFHKKNPLLFSLLLFLFFEIPVFAANPPGDWSMYWWENGQLKRWNLDTATTTIVEGAVKSGETTLFMNPDTGELQMMTPETHGAVFVKEEDKDAMTAEYYKALEAHYKEEVDQGQKDFAVWTGSDGKTYAYSKGDSSPKEVELKESGYFEKDGKYYKVNPDTKKVYSVSEEEFFVHGTKEEFWAVSEGDEVFLLKRGDMEGEVEKYSDGWQRTDGTYFWTGSENDPIFYRVSLDGKTVEKIGVEEYVGLSPDLSLEQKAFFKDALLSMAYELVGTPKQAKLEYFCKLCFGEDTAEESSYLLDSMTSNNVEGLNLTVLDNLSYVDSGKGILCGLNGICYPYNPVGEANSQPVGRIVKVGSQYVYVSDNDSQQYKEQHGTQLSALATQAELSASDRVVVEKQASGGASPSDSKIGDQDLTGVASGCSGFGCSGGDIGEEQQPGLESCATALSCSHYYAQNVCGYNLDNGCGGTISCVSCPTGFVCRNGSCACTPKTACSLQSKCGEEDNGCGGKIFCGSCPAGLQCDLQYRECVPEKEKTYLDLSEISVFAYSNYAVLSWNTSVPSDSIVFLGKTPALGLQQNVSFATKTHSLLLEGLQPDLVYYYKVRVVAGSESRESSGSFKTLKVGADTGPLKVLMVSVDPPGRAEYEGYAFSFTALTNSLNPSELEFEWDFGDGFVSKKAGYVVYHSYYGLTEKEKDFNVRVIARDKNGFSAESSLTVKVLKAVFKPVVLSPSQFELLSKKGKLAFSIVFLDEQEKMIPCKKIVLKAIFAGQSIEMKCDDGNLFSGSVLGWHGLDELELLAIYASYTLGERTYFVKTRAPVYLAPARISVSDIFRQKKYFLNDSLGKAKARFLIEKIMLVFPQNLKAQLVSSNWSKDVNIERQEYDYILSFDHVVSETDLLEGLKLKLEGRDSHGNIVAELIELPLEKSNPELRIELIEPIEGSSGFAFGQRLRVRAKAIHKSPSLKNKALFLECGRLDLFTGMEFDSTKKEYFSEILLPLPGFGNATILCSVHAYGFEGERQVESVAHFTVNLSGNLGIEFVLPSQGNFKVFGGRVGQLRVKLLQENGKPFEGLDVNAVLVVDGKTMEKTLKFDSWSGVHYADLDSPLEAGQHSLAVSLSQPFQGNNEILTVIEEDVFAGFLLSSLVLLIVVGLLVWFFWFFSRNALAERKALLAEKQKLLGLRKKYKFEFFKRHISEKEFRERSKAIDKSLELVSGMLRHGAWVRVGLMKTIYRTNDIKKLPLKAQAEALCIRLAGKSGEFSRIEVAKTLLSEGYQEKTINEVLDRLFK